MKQADMDLLLAKAQVWFAGGMLFGVFALLFTLIFFHGQMTATSVTIITSVITALVTILTLQMNFFYARQRPAALPDPTNTTTTTTSTTEPAPLIVPEGAKVLSPTSPVIVSAPATDPQAPQKKI